MRENSRQTGGLPNIVTMAICFISTWQCPEAGYEGSHDEAGVPAQLLQGEDGHSDVQEDKVLRQEVGELKQLYTQNIQTLYAG